MVNNIPRGSTLFKSGEYIGSVNFIGNNTRSSSSAHIAGSIVNTIGSVFFAAFASKVSGASSGGGGGEAKPSAEQVQLNKLETAKAKAEAEVDNKARALATYKERESELNEQVDPKTIESTKAALDEAKQKIEGKNEELAQKILAADSAIDTATKDLNSISTKYGEITKDIGKLEMKKARFEALTDDPVAQAKVEELGSAIIAKKSEQGILETKKEQAEQNLQKAKDEKESLSKSNANYDSVVQDIQAYNGLKNTYDSLIGRKETNEKALKTLRETTIPNAEIELKEAQAKLDQAEDALLEFKGSIALEQQGRSKKAESAGKDYAAADKADGNWWKRNMPSWLGGASKTEKEQMKKAHETKEKLGNQIENLGFDASQYSYKNTLKANNAQEFAKLGFNPNDYSAKQQANFLAQRKTNEFIEKFKSNNTAITALNNIRHDIADYYKENPDASDKDIKKKFKINDDGTPMS